MDFAGTEETAAAPGVRTAVDFYTRKADGLQQRQRELEAELALVQTELAKARTTRDQLADALDEILAQAPSAAEEQGTQAETAPTGHTPPSDEPPAAASTAETADSPQGPRRGPSRTARPRKQASAAKSGEVMLAIEQLLATSGKPMHVKDVTAALGRPTDGKEGTAAIETIRATCKRLVGHGRVTEVKTAVFAIARTTQAHPTDEAAPGGEAGLKGAA